jgi:hypothetical protein
VRNINRTEIYEEGRKIKVNKLRVPYIQHPSFKAVWEARNNLTECITKDEAIEDINVRDLPTLYPTTFRISLIPF